MLAEVVNILCGGNFCFLGKEEKFPPQENKGDFLGGFTVNMMK